MQFYITVSETVQDVRGHVSRRDVAACAVSQGDLQEVMEIID